MNRRGANAVEFGLTIPVFLAILFGGLEYGWYFANQAMLDSALGRGCSLGALVDPTLDPCAPKLEAHEQITKILDSMPSLSCDESLSGNCTITIDNESLSLGVGSLNTTFIECSIELDFRSVTNLYAMPSLVKTSTTSRLEHQTTKISNPTGCY
jgi:hypothetical protein